MLTSVLNTALSGLRSSQALLDTTTRNIVNAGTDGYSKKVQGSVTVEPHGGVKAGRIYRVEDNYTLRQLRHTLSDKTAAKYKMDALNELNDLSGDPADAASLPAKLNALTDAFQKMAVNPSQPELRSAVILAAERLAATLNNLHQDISTKNLDVVADTNDAIGKANDLITRVAEINEKIAANTAAGVDVSDMKDRRDGLLKELSNYMKVEGFEDDRGIFHLHSADHKLLATNRVVAQLSWDQGGQISAAGTPISPIGGQIQAGLDIKTTLKNKQDQLDEIAKQVTLAFYDTSTTADVGIELFRDAGNTPFNPATGTADYASRIMVNTDFVNNSALLLGQGPVPTNPTDSATAVKAREVLLKTSFTFTTPGLPSPATLEEATTLFVSGVAGDASAAKSEYEDRSSVEGLLTKRLTDQTGVSVDEELQKMIYYQNAYNSSARVMQATREMLDELLRIV